MTEHFKRRLNKYFRMFLDLRGNGHYISHFTFWYEDKELQLLARTNGVWQNASITNTFPFTSEKVYKVTLLATLSEIKVHIVDFFIKKCFLRFHSVEAL